MPYSVEVVHGLGEIVAAREFWPRGAHPGFEISDQRRAQILADGAALVGATTIDAALDLEQRIDAADGFEREG